MLHVLLTSFCPDLQGTIIVIICCYIISVMMTLKGMRPEGFFG